MNIISEVSDLGVLGILMFTMYMQSTNNDKITKALNNLTIAINRLLELERIENNGGDNDKN